jgi:endonuclease/exonuclease/phosphatase family metal-dependent hydrolase
MSSTTRTAVLWIDRLLLATFLLGAAAAYLDPTHYWLGAMIAVSLPLLGSLLLPCALILWRSRKRLLALAHVLLLVLVASRHFSLERFLEPRPSKHDLVLMSWNAPREPESRELGEEVARLVRAAEPDMIALQESTIFAYEREPERIRSQVKLAPLIETLSYSMHPPRLGPPDKEWTVWYQPLLARFEIDQQEQLSFPREDPHSQPFRLLRSEFTWQGRKIAHYNIHLSTHRPTEPRRADAGGIDSNSWSARFRKMKASYRMRAWEVERVRELLDEERHPVILSGDFNSTPDSWIYRRLSDGFQDAFRVAGSGWGATYHSALPAFRIDFVLLGPEFEVVRAEVPSFRPPLSDHRPLVVRFRWRGP